MNLDQKKISESLHDSLASLQDDLNHLKNSVEKPDRKDFSDSLHEKLVTSKELSDLEDRVKVARIESDLEAQRDKQNIGKVSVYQEQKMITHVKDIKHWVVSSDRLNKAEMAQSATHLLQDLVVQQPNVLANAFRKIANRFLS